MIKARILHRKFQYRRPATTSRGTYFDKKVYYIVLYHTDEPSIAGIGECSLFPGLSIDDNKSFEAKLQQTIDRINQGEYSSDSTLSEWPSINFAQETAWKDIRVGGSKLLYPSGFTEGRDSIEINGLIWLGSKEEMIRQIRERLLEGFTCLKLKIGSIKLGEELEILEFLRKEYTPEELEIRVDANGAFKIREAQEILHILSKYKLHSIEQPIPAGHAESMAALCESSPVPIALDEELIGIHTASTRRKLLEIIKPQYLVLKPGLLGGIASSAEWVSAAREKGTKWWITSSLETNIGLNAIAQWTFTLNNPIAHGLSTGSMFMGNISSPLYLSGERLYYDPDRKWDLSVFDDSLPV